MTGPICLFFRFNWKEAWYQLSEQEQQAIFAKLREGREKAGATMIVSCRSRWAGEQYGFFGIEEYPDLQALQQFTQWQEEMNLYRYIDAETMLGSKVE